LIGFKGRSYEIGWRESSSGTICTEQTVPAARGALLRNRRVAWLVDKEVNAMQI
jgi:hypothetical protein